MIAKKSNYVKETCHKFEMVYGSGMSDVERERIRINCFFVLLESGKAMSYDEVNELLNLCNKSCVPILSFETVCSRSKHIALLRKCAFEGFGRNITRSAQTSHKSDEMKLIMLFRRANVLPPPGVHPRKMESDFFWAFV